MDYTLDDYNNAVSEANSVYDIAYAEAETVFVKACAVTRENFDEVAFHARANAVAEAVRDNAVSEARARLAVII